jgi:hypothetical protein
MKFLGFVGKIGVCLAICGALANADSLQLRNGRHLQGKYIGGTSTAVGFMSGATVEYFATADVLALIFENSNDSPLGGMQQQPKPMTGNSKSGVNEAARMRRVSVSTRNGKRSSHALTPPDTSVLLRVRIPESGNGQKFTEAEQGQDLFWPLSL